MVAAGLALAGAAILVAGTVIIMVAIQRRPYQAEVAPTKGSPGQGVLYAFTLGMAPWAKESARRHWVAYLRGIVFHIIIFMGGLFLIASPWLTEFASPLRVSLAALFALGAALTFAGFGIRLSDPALRRLSTPDDYFSLALVTLLLTSGAMAAAQIELLPAFWAISGITMAYMPFGKLRHFLYFFYERAFLGLVFGSRGVLKWKHE